MTIRVADVPIDPVRPFYQGEVYRFDGLPGSPRKAGWVTHMELESVNVQGEVFYRQERWSRKDWMDRSQGLEIPGPEISNHVIDYLTLEALIRDGVWTRIDSDT